MAGEGDPANQSSFLVNVGGDSNIVRFSTKKKDHKPFKPPRLRPGKPAEGDGSSGTKYAQDARDRGRGSGGFDPVTGEE